MEVWHFGAKLLLFLEDFLSTDAIFYEYFPRFFFHLTKNNFLKKYFFYNFGIYFLNYFGPNLTLGYSSQE
jgi:hypothetical protein